MRPCLFCDLFAPAVEGGPFVIAGPTAVGQHCAGLGFTYAADTWRSPKPLQWSLREAVMCSCVPPCLPGDGCVQLLASSTLHAPAGVQEVSVPSKRAIYVKKEISRFLEAFLWDETQILETSIRRSLPHKSQVRPCSPLRPGAHLRYTPPPIPRTPAC